MGDRDESLVFRFTVTARCNAVECLAVRRVANDCGAFAICVPQGPNSGNVCMSVCLTNAQCRPGYSCNNAGYSQKICQPN